MRDKLFLKISNFDKRMWSVDQIVLTMQKEQTPVVKRHLQQHNVLNTPLALNDLLLI